jgi:hypothetical protein
MAREHRIKLLIEDNFDT